MLALFELIKKLVSAKWYGEIRIKFQAGQIKHIEKEESLDVTQYQ
jgi:hypothetical protein